MYTFKVGIDPKEHDDFVKSNPLCNLLQSSSWAKVKYNWESEIVGVYQDGQLVASSLVLIKLLPLKFTMFYTPRGPVMDYKNRELVEFFMKNLKKFAKTKHCLFIKSDPSIHYNDYKVTEQNDDHYDVTEEMDNIAYAGGKHKSFATNISENIQPRYQANVYKSETFEEDLPRHTRRLLKDAQKRGVHVSVTGAERLDEFSDVVELTEERKGVNLRNREYFKHLMETYGDDAFLFLGEVNLDDKLNEFTADLEAIEKEIAETPENARKKLNRLNDQKKSVSKYIQEFTAFKETYPTNVVIAGVLSIKFGNTMEMLYAGMNDDFKKFYPQYMIYVENMNFAFDRGCEWCNMGGVQGDLNDGLTKFKSNFNPMINEFIGEFDFPVNKLLYGLSEWAYALRKKRRSNTE
ncbi:aminoacyltransferase [Isobaculum melis]|uniref:Serine/alanine adding enzyme n=1 Tax=Isobaculum melis TaxID=142588 RepID=A0A1H9TCW6_9LACT|nr:aminoacyltransferase [Isobaculum melis]SER95062.1 serine/alanine adding enzyme [Isobaculum melis]